MSPIPGRLFDGRTTSGTDATLEIAADHTVRLVIPEGGRIVPLDEVEVSDRIGHIPRRLRFSDGSVFETADNDAVDRAIDALGRRRFLDDVGRWERLWGAALASLVLVVALSWAFLRFGVPALATFAARTLPPSVDRAIGIQGLEILDESIFEPSELPLARQDELRRRFDSMTAPLVDGHEYRLELRKAGEVGANAFALPSGLVVVTDELVERARSDEEIVSVLAHEIGHVRGRHALRMILQSAGVAALALALLGDVSSVSALATALPTTLLQAQHSRDFEREADAFAREWMQRHGVEPGHFDAILCRLVKEAGSEPRGALAYLSSHPPADERANCMQVPGASPSTPKGS